jgi:hypothetical protein
VVSGWGMFLYAMAAPRDREGRAAPATPEARGGRP